MEGAEGTGLDRVLFLAYALGLWAQLSLLGQGGGAGARGRAYTVEVGEERQGGRGRRKCGGSRFLIPSTYTGSCTGS